MKEVVFHQHCTTCGETWGKHRYSGECPTNTTDAYGFPVYATTVFSEHKSHIYDEDICVHCGKTYGKHSGLKSYCPSTQTGEIWNTKSIFFKDERPTTITGRIIDDPLKQVVQMPDPGTLPSLLTKYKLNEGGFERALRTLEKAKAREDEMARKLPATKYGTKDLAQEQREKERAELIRQFMDSAGWKTKGDGRQSLTIDDDDEIPLPPPPKPPEPKYAKSWEDIKDIAYAYLEFVFNGVAYYVIKYEGNRYFFPIYSTQMKDVPLYAKERLSGIEGHIKAAMANGEFVMETKKD